MKFRIDCRHGKNDFRFLVVDLLIMTTSPVNLSYFFCPLIGFEYMKQQNTSRRVVKNERPVNNTNKKNSNFQQQRGK